MCQAGVASKWIRLILVVCRYSCFTKLSNFIAMSTLICCFITCRVLTPSILIQIADEAEGDSLSRTGCCCRHSAQGCCCHPRKHHLKCVAGFAKCFVTGFMRASSAEALHSLLCSARDKTRIRLPSSLSETRICSHAASCRRTMTLCFPLRYKVPFIPFSSSQEPHAKQVKELLAAQEAVAKERSRLETLQEEIKAKRTELAAQVC